jgi:hypothetical protein
VEDHPYPPWLGSISRKYLDWSQMKCELTSLCSDSPPPTPPPKGKFSQHGSRHHKKVYMKKPTFCLESSRHGSTPCSKKRLHLASSYFWDAPYSKPRNFLSRLFSLPWANQSEKSYEQHLWHVNGTFVGLPPQTLSCTALSKFSKFYFLNVWCDQSWVNKKIKFARME